jgi:ABC-type uncharacterized transport system auxiliary subunit
LQSSGINSQTQFLKIKPLIMKRLVTILALAGTLVACNNSADSTEQAKDSIDSSATERKEMIDSSAEQRKDAIDSTADQKKDAMDRADSAANKK